MRKKLWSILHNHGHSSRTGHGTLRETDRVAKIEKVNRSALILELDELERQGYQRFPDTYDPIWEEVQVWPEEQPVAT